MTMGSIIWRIAAVLGVTAFAVVFVLELDRRLGLYWYDVAEDYRYTFASDAAEKLAVQVAAGGITIPELPGGWDTAVLALRIESTIAGHWFEPEIRIETDSTSRVHTFERGSAGLRYLVLDPDAARPGAVRLTGRHVRWREQDADLLLFSTPEIASAKLLVIAPHPDDAEIAAFGLYSAKDSHVATVSAGNYVDGRYASLAADLSEQERLRGRARAWDSLVVPTWGGVDPRHAVNFGYSNGSIRELYEGRHGPAGFADEPSRNPNDYRSGAVAGMLGGRRAESSWRSLVDDLKAVIESVRPGVIAAPHPLLDAAADHQFTTIALLEALAAAGDDSTVLLLYTNHHVLSEYYPFGPSGTAVTLPPWFDGNSIFFGVYSHPLDEPAQMNKLFALEAMHDLRAAPRLLYGGPTPRFIAQVTAAVNGIVRDPLGTYSYYRRSVRANEIFFVVRPENRESFEASLAALF